MINKRIYIHNGKEYVSNVEFSERIGITAPAVTRFISTIPNIETIHKDGDKTVYYNYEQAYRAYAEYSKKRKRPTKKETSEYIKITTPSTKAPSVPSIPSVSMDEKDTNGKNIVNLSTLDPNDFQDCWVIDPINNNVINHPVTNEPMLDYDMVKAKLTSIKYQFDIDEKRGLYVSKDVLKRYVTGISKILETALEAIPRRYSAQIIAECSDLTKHNFTAEENARLRAVLKNEAPAIMTSIQTEIAKMVDEGEK